MLQATMGLPANAFPVVPVVDFGITLKPKEAKRPPKSISPAEAQELFGISESVKMNFVPQMLIAVALDEVAKFINHCREHRIREFKKHNRLIKVCVEEYTAELQKSYGAAFRAYASYVERYFQFVEVDRFKMWCSISNIVNRQLPQDSDREAATLIAIIHNLINYAEKWDSKMDKLIAAKLDVPVHRKQNQYLLLITAMCIEFEETWGFQIKPDAMIDMNMAVMANRASELADSIIGEESNSYRTDSDEIYDPDTEFRFRCDVEAE